MSMVNIFDQAEARSSRVSDAHFGEPIRIRTMKAGVNVKSRPDPDRSDFQTVGIFKVMGKRFRTDNEYVGLAGKEAEVSIDQRRLLASLKQGDHIERLKTGVVYKVAAIEPDGEGRSTYKLMVVQ